MCTPSARPPRGDRARSRVRRDIRAVPAELPENSPRYVLLSYELNHADGRKSFPLVLVNWAPTSSEMSLLTLHASAFIEFQNTVRTTYFCSTLVNGRTIRFGVISATTFLALGAVMYAM